MEDEGPQQAVPERRPGEASASVSDHEHRPRPPGRHHRDVLLDCARREYVHRVPLALAAVGARRLVDRPAPDARARRERHAHRNVPRDVGEVVEAEERRGRAAGGGGRRRPDPGGEQDQGEDRCAH